MQSRMFQNSCFILDLTDPLKLPRDPLEVVAGSPREPLKILPNGSPVLFTSPQPPPLPPGHIQPKLPVTVSDMTKVLKQNSVTVSDMTKMPKQNSSKLTIKKPAVLLIFFQFIHNDCGDDIIRDQLTLIHKSFSYQTHLCNKKAMIKN